MARDRLYCSPKIIGVFDITSPKSGSFVGYIGYHYYFLMHVANIIGVKLFG